jgi:hypothetical protein
MKYLLLLLSIAGFSAKAQEKQKKNFDLTSRANDHFIFQFSLDNWLNAPDSIDSHIKGFSRGANVYFMLDKPFKSNQKFSIAAGLGIGTSNIFFKEMLVDINTPGKILQFSETDSTGKYKKYKLTTAYAELPLEFRYSSHPDQPNKSMKLAIGLKGGLMLNAHTKGKQWETSTGNRIREGTEKTSGKQYFNSSRIALTLRAGYGVWGVFGSYELTPLFKTGVASQDIRLMQLGICISGL